jgi:hypothetical protein
MAFELEIKVPPDLTAAEVTARCKELLQDYYHIYIENFPIRLGDPPFPIRGHDVIHRGIDYGIGTS